jgi:hypothetical protein
MACALPLKWLGLRRVPSAAPGMLNHTPRAFFRQTKTTHYCRRARRSSGVNDVGAGKSAVTDNIRCKRIANFRHGHDHALDVRPKVRTARMCDVAFWPIASFRCAAGIWSLSGHSRHRLSRTYQARFMSTRALDVCLFITSHLQKLRISKIFCASRYKKLRLSIRKTRDRSAPIP